MRTLFALLSFTLAVALAVAWARSYDRPDVLVLYGPGGRPAAGAVRRGVVYGVAGNVALGPRRDWSTQLLHPSAPAFDGLCDDQLAAADWHHGRAGFLLARAPQPWADGATFWAVTAPAWAVVPLLMVLPIRWAWLVARDRRRRRRGLCRRCGYDRRASPGRCPECGASASSE